MQRHEPLKDNFITSDEASALLAVSTRTLSRWARLRKGPPRIKVGRSIYYRRDAMEHWLIGLESRDGVLATVATRFGK